MPQWVESCLWWHVYPLGFAGAPIHTDESPEHRLPTGAGGLRSLLPWLDHAVELGLNGLLLGPVFESWSHGYDTLDHLRVDPRLGTEQDLADLIAACHDRGIRVALDGVFNHVSERHPRFVEARDAGFTGPAADWFDIDRSDPTAPRPRVFEGHGSLVALNHSNPEVAAYVVDVMTYWLDRGVDAWRLDAAYAVDTAFWRAVLPRVRDRHPDAWFVGEVIHGDYSAFTGDGGLDSVTQYELWKSIWSSLADRNFFELDWTLTRHNGYLERFLPQTFVGNHDVTRIASTVGTDATVLAAAALLTVGGVPSIYAGDEWGFLGVKQERAGGDDAVRPAFPASPAGLPPDGAAIFRAHQDLVGLRRRHPWLVRARTRPLELTNTRYVYEASDGDDALTVELDVTGAPTARVVAPDGTVLFGWG